MLRWARRRRTGHSAQKRLVHFGFGFAFSERTGHRQPAACIDKMLRGPTGAATGGAPSHEQQQGQQSQEGYRQELERVEVAQQQDLLGG